MTRTNSFLSRKSTGLTQKLKRQTNQHCMQSFPARGPSHVEWHGIFGCWLWLWLWLWLRLWLLVVVLLLWLWLWLWCAVVGCGDCGSDEVFHTKESVLLHVPLHLIKVAEHLRVRLPASPPSSPRRPTTVGHRGLHLGLDVWMDGVRKMPHFC